MRSHSGFAAAAVPLIPSSAAIGLRETYARLADRAQDEARAPAAVREAVGELGQAGLLAAPLPRGRRGGRDLGLTPEGAREAVSVLLVLGSADLSMARLYEGHVNALRLITLHGENAHLDRAEACIAGDGMLGVWGAEADRPVRLVDGRLSGTKVYCSGLGSVDLAVVPVRDGDAQQLLIAETTDAARGNPGAWNMHGMRATHSGSYCFDDLRVGGSDAPAERLGGPDAYRREPGFLAGVWRLAAAELGGVFGLLEAARTDLAARDRLGDRLHLARLGDALISAHAARALALEAGLYAEGPSGRAAPECAANLSILARLAAERAAEETLGAVGRCLGLGGFVAGSTAERQMRDLATYMRQMNPDGLRERAAHALLGDPVPLAEAFDERG